MPLFSWAHLTLGVTCDFLLNGSKNKKWHAVQMDSKHWLFEGKKPNNVKITDQ